MAVINHAKREINAKIVYFGPPGCGKGELLRFIHQRIKPGLCGPLKTMPVGSDTMLFFDYIPFDTSSLDGYRIRFHLYTLTGPVANPGTWKMTLKGLDGLTFVTAGETVGSNSVSEHFQVLRSILTGYGKDLRSLPRLWLPCDAGEETSVIKEIDAIFGGSRKIVCSLFAGEGVLQSLAQLSQAVLQQLRQEYEPVVQSVATDVGGAAMLRLDDPASRQSAIVTLPEVKMTLTEDAIVQIPLAIQSGSKVTRCMLSLSLKIEE